MDIKNKFTWIFSLVFLILVGTSLSVMAAIQLGTEEVTFTQPIVVSTPTLPTHATTKAYVDSAVAGTSQGTVTSVGTGSGLTGGPITSSGTISVDSTVVRTTGDQTIGGIKTFSSAVVLNTAGTATNHAVRADRSISTGSGLTGGGNLTANRTLTVDSTVIRTTGDQTIGGIKTFSSAVIVATPTATNHATTKAYVDSAIANIGIGGYVPTSRTIATGSGLTGGGDLTANRTLTVDSTVLRTTGNYTITGKFYPASTSNRGAGMYGIYDSYKVGHIWSMGTGYQIPEDGSNFGNLYGLAYKHTNNTTGGTMAGGHQMVWVQNGVGTAAIGTGIWTSGTGVFGGTVTVATPTATNHAVTKAYVDAAVGGTTQGTVTSITAGSGLSGGTITTSGTIAVDSTVIRTTGDQTLGGNKTFSSAVILSTAGTATNHAVRADRSVLTGSGLSGGGNLTANRTLTVDSTVIRTTGNQTLGGTKTFSSPVVASYYNVNSGNGNGLRFWADDSYKISMGNTAEYKYGPVTDYSIKMSMNTTTTRGWTWGVVGVAPVAAISTQGHMQIAGNLITIGKIGVGVTAPTEKLEVNGNVLANAYFYTSDIRLKENVSNVENSLSKILQLQGISYNLKGDEQKRVGFSAQELQKIYPELVRENNDGYLSIDGSGLIAPLVEAIKEQQKEIEALKKKVEELSKD